MPLTRLHFLGQCKNKADYDQDSSYTTRPNEYWKAEKILPYIYFHAFAMQDITLWTKLIQYTPFKYRPLQICFFFLSLKLQSTLNIGKFPSSWLYCTKPSHNRQGKQKPSGGKISSVWKFQTSSCFSFLKLSISLSLILSIPHICAKALYLDRNKWSTYSGKYGIK